MPEDRPPEDGKSPIVQRKSPDSGGQSVGPLATIGVEVGLTVAVLSVLGWWLDAKWDTTPWLTLTGATIGIIGVTYKMLRLSAAMDKKRPPGSSPPQWKKFDDDENEKDNDGKPRQP